MRTSHAFGQSIICLCNDCNVTSFSSNHSRFLRFLKPSILSQALYTETLKFSHEFSQDIFSISLTNFSLTAEFYRPATLRRLGNLVQQLRFLGLTTKFNLPRTSWWSVQRSTPSIARTICTSAMSRLLTNKKSIKCHCFEPGCVQVVLNLSFIWNIVLVI